MSSIEGSRGVCIAAISPIARGEVTDLRQFLAESTVRVATGSWRGSCRPVVPIARDIAIIAERIVERPALEPEIVGLGLAHRVKQLEAGDIGVAPRGDQQRPAH